MPDKYGARLKELESKRKFFTERGDTDGVARVDRKVALVHEAQARAAEKAKADKGPGARAGRGGGRRAGSRTQ